MATIADVDRSTGFVASAVAGDEVAFARIVAAHHADMFRVAYLVTGEADAAMDAVQSAWHIAWTKLPSLHEPDRLRPWLASITANEARQLLRKRRRRQLREITVEGWDDRSEPLSPGLDQGDRGLDLRNALQRLSPGDRGVIAMRYALGLSHEEIGRATGLSIPGVRSRLARALERLRRDLGDD
jgi:RNA polymerase sigma-70 factor (ECF subfamily)